MKWLFVIILLLGLVLIPLSAKCDSVSVGNVKPQFSNIDLSQENGRYNLTIIVSDYNGWHDISTVLVKFIKNSNIEIVWGYEQTENRFYVMKGPPPLKYYYQKSHGVSVAEITELTVGFVFEISSYNKLEAEVSDSSGAVSTMHLFINNLNQGFPITQFLLPSALLLTYLFVSFKYKYRRLEFEE